MRKLRVVDALSALETARPCPASWASMEGDGQVRHCSQCRRNVYNLSEMTRAEAIRVIESHEGKLCARYYRRADGMIMTKDCGLGWRIHVKVASAFASVLCLFGLSMPMMAQGGSKSFVDMSASRSRTGARLLEDDVRGGHKDRAVASAYRKAFDKAVTLNDVIEDK